MAITEALSAAAERLSTQWPFVLTAALTCAVAWLLQVLLRPDSLSKIPLIGGDFGDEAKRRAAYIKSARDMFLEGHRKFKNGVFRVTTPKESQVIVVSPVFLHELKDLPDDVISFHGSVEESMHTKWTSATADRPILPFVIKKDLTPGLNRLNPVIAEEVDLALREELPPCKDFTRIPLNHHLLRIVSKVSGRVFVGPELCRSEEYIDMSINYTVELMAAAQAISSLRPEDRDAKAGSLEAIKKLRTRQKTAFDFVRPLIAARKQAIRDDPDFQKPDDALQWVLDGGQDKYGAQDDQELTETQMALTFAAIHTTTLSATNAFYTIAAMPELIPELREEIRSVLNEYGTFTTAALQKMKKLDSFLREVMRVWPLSFASFGRKVKKTITLSNGQVIPAGCIIEVPAHSAMNDPDVYANPEKFDPWRAYRLRTESELKGGNKASAGAVNQMVAVSTSNLNFGYGRHACPGRFFAANEIKMIFGRALLDYDIRTVDGSRDRYQNVVFAESYIPDATKELLFKRVAI